MRFSDYIEQSFSNLLKKKVRTFLTTFGVVIGVGALVSMISFGKGIQKNITDTFEELELFNYISVYPRGGSSRDLQPGRDPDEAQAPATAPTDASPDSGTDGQGSILDDDFIREVTKIEGVESAFPEVRFPSLVRFRDKERSCLIQVLPADICRSGLMKLRAGRAYEPNEPNGLVVSDSMLRRMKITEPQSVIGDKIEIATLTVDFSLSNLPNIIAFIQGRGLPFSQNNYTFTIVGVAEMGFGGPMPLRSDVYIAPAASNTMKKLSLTSIWDLFQTPGRREGYSVVNIRLSSPKYVESVKTKMEDRGLRAFALIDHLEEVRTGFLFMDMILFAIGMVAITVAALGIINTMVMSILERFKEIGIMKAVGASNRDIKKIFFFESGVIGFLGGLFGLGLGWAVSMIINQVANYFLARQGVPHMNYFSFPWWLCLGAIAFSILVSLAAGVYPTLRAARVDPVVALRHD